MHAITYGIVPRESLYPIASKGELYLTTEGPCWIVETRMNAVDVFERKSSPTLTCVDHSSKVYPFLWG